MTYIINNFLNRRKLKHNKAIYQKLGIKKSIYAPLGKKDIQDITMPGPWLDGLENSEIIQNDSSFQQLSSQYQEHILQFIEKGYFILPKFLNETTVVEINNEIQSLIDNRKLDFNYTGKKIVESYKHSPLVNGQFFRNPELIELFKFIFQKEIIPFHTINFIEGSEQRAHSDSIHMSTAPEGFMIAAWAALEPTDEGNGPLFYYPGSHKLPYLSCLDYNSGNSKYLIGDKSYANYEDHIAKMIHQHKLKKEYFYAKTGDVLIWHANLLHGGDPIKQKGRSRRSMVAHYFAKEVLCFHEISQRPALLSFE